MIDATIFHSSLLMSFFSCSLVTCTSLRTFLSRLSCFSSISFMVTSRDGGTIGGDGGACILGSSSSIDCKLLVNALNIFGSPIVDKPSTSNPDSLSDDNVLLRFLPVLRRLVVRTLDWKSPIEVWHLSRRPMGCGRMELRLSYSISSRTSSCSLMCFSMTFMSPEGTLTRTIFASQSRTMVLIHIGISVTEGLL